MNGKDHAENCKAELSRGKTISPFCLFVVVFGAVCTTTCGAACSILYLVFALFLVLFLVVSCDDEGHFFLLFSALIGC